MVAPNDPRDRLPPLLRRYCPDSETIKRWLRVGEALTFLTRFAGACARGWLAVDQTARLFVVCVIGLVLLAALLPSVALWCVAIVALLVFAWRAWHWSELDRRGRLLVIGGNAAGIIALVLAIAGPGDHKDRREGLPGTMEAAHVMPDAGVTHGATAEEHVIDPRMVEAYEVHQRFVLKSVFFRYGGMTGYWIQPVPGYSCIADNFRFLPVTQTRIARNGNYYRIRGRITFDIEGHGQGEPPSKDQWVEYACQMDHDPDLDVWRLVGNVEEIASNIPGRVP